MIINIRPKDESQGMSDDGLVLNSVFLPEQCGSLLYSIADLPLI